MNENELVEYWKEEEEKPFSGWNFSCLDGRMLEEQAPWSYTMLASELLDKASAVLDIGTGGGEQLLKMKDHWPEKVAATEEYPPNFKLATECLSPFDVRVVEVSQNTEAIMPFSDGEFDLVLNRHSGFNPAEVARVLSPGGIYFTQQVHGMSGADLAAFFDTEQPWPFATPEYFVPQLQSAGLTICEVQEWTGKMAFTDVGALVYYLKAVPWVVESFSVETHKEYLLRLQEKADHGEDLSFSIKRYLIRAKKVQQ